MGILRGYIKTWNFPVKIAQGGERPTRDNIIQWFEEEKLNQFDYVDYSGETISVTRNPFGFINVNAINKKKYGGGDEKKIQTKRKKEKVNKKTRKNIVEKERGLL